MSDDHESKDVAADPDRVDDRAERANLREGGNRDPPAGKGPEGKRGGGGKASPAAPDEGEIAGVDARRETRELSVPQFAPTRLTRLHRVQLVDGLPTDRPFEVPQFSPHAARRFTVGELDVPVSVGADAGITSIPQFSPGTVGGPITLSFDEGLPETLERVQQVQIPQFSVDRCPLVRPFSSFLETVAELPADSTALETPVIDEEVPEEDRRRERTIPEGLADALGGLAAGDEWATNEWPDPMELLFGAGSSSLTSTTPIVVLVDDDELVGVVETVVKRLYREQEGGEPKLTRYNTATQLATEERWLSADSQLFTVTLSDDEWDEFEKDHRDKWQSIWQNRFDQLFSGQRFGAIIFNRRHVPGLEVTSLPHHPPTLIELEGRIPWHEVAPAFWSALPEDTQHALTFSQLFDRDADGVVRERWQRTLNAADGKFDLATTAHEAESNIHYAMKVFVVTWLAEQLCREGGAFAAYDDVTEIEDYREIETAIPTERPISSADKSDVIPDVLYESQVFEVETFFGEATDTGVMSKLQQTVRKYEGVQRVEGINIVVDNLTCLLHLKELARFKRTHRVWEQTHVPITISTIDLAQGELVPLSEIVSRLTETVSD